MFNSTALEVAIGVALVYLLLSLFCTAVNEVIASIMKSRARNLERGIKSLFTEGNLTAALSLTDAVYRHGLIQSLYRSDGGTAATTPSQDIKNPPAYIPSRTFASALYSILFPALDNPLPTAGGSPTPADTKTHLDAMLAAINALPTQSPGREAIRTLVKEADGDVQKTRLAFEHWYDDGMDRAAGWYKKRTQRALFLIGLVGAVILNVNTIVVVRNLWSNPTMRSFAVGYADKVSTDTAIKATVARQKAEADAAVQTTSVSPGPNAASTAGSGVGTEVPQKPAEGSKNGEKPKASEGGSLKISDASKELEALKSLNLPIGWKESALLDDWEKDKTSWCERFNWVLAVQALFGWFLTAIAVTLGAPFWFDTLNQFMVVRSTIKPREKSDIEGSKDSQKKS